MYQICQHPFQRVKSRHVVLHQVTLQLCLTLTLRHLKHSLYTGAVSAFSIFDGYVWSVLVEKNLGFMKGPQKTTLSKLAPKAFIGTNTKDWTWHTALESQSSTNLANWTPQQCLRDMRETRLVIAQPNRHSYLKKTVPLSR